MTFIPCTPPRIVTEEILAAAARDCGLKGGGEGKSIGELGAVTTYVDDVSPVKVGRRRIPFFEATELSYIRRQYKKYAWVFDDPVAYRTAQRDLNRKSRLKTGPWPIEPLPSK